MRLGPAHVGACTDVAPGLAALLERQPLGHVTVRYRVLARSSYAGDQPPVIYGALEVELAAQGSSAELTGVSGGQLPLPKLASPIDGMTNASEWTTFDAPAPGLGPIGVAIGIGSGAARGGCGGCGGCGGPLSGADMELLVDAIAAK